MYTLEIRHMTIREKTILLTSRHTKEAEIRLSEFFFVSNSRENIHRQAVSSFPLLFRSDAILECCGAISATILKRCTVVIRKRHYLLIY